MFRSLLYYRYKTLLIIISATAAITSTFLITALSNGIVQMYAQMLRTDGDIIVTEKGVADTFFSDVNLSLSSSIAKIEGVRSVQGVIVGAGKIDTVPIAGIYGVTPNRYHNYQLSSGKYPRRQGEVMIGESINMLLVDPKTVTLMGRTFHVTGIYHSDIGFENGGVVLGIEDAQRLFHKGASFLLISLKDISQSESIIDKIKTLSSRIDVKSTREFIDNYNQFKIIRISGGVIASISFFMGFLAIVSLMSLMVGERVYEFGIKRALGISRIRIIKEVIVEVIALTLFAFVLAYLLSVFGLDILMHIKRFQGYLSGQIGVALFVELLCGSLLMAVIGALIPAWMASRVDPITLINRGK